MRKVWRLVEKHPVAALVGVVVVFLIAWLAFHMGLIQVLT